MATGNSVGDEIREQHQKMKGKTLKEKFGYFWEYYKIHTIVVIAVILAASNMIYTIATSKDNAMEAAFVNTFLKDGVDAEAMAADFELYAQIDTKDYEATIDPSMYVDYDGQDEYSYANIQKLIAMISAQSLDVLITDDAYIEHNVDMGAFIDLHQLYSDEELDKYQDRLLYWDLEDGNGEVPIGFDVRDSKYLMSDQLPAWFCPVSTTLNPENTLKFLDYMLEP